MLEFRSADLGVNPKKRNSRDCEGALKQMVRRTL